MGNATLVKPYPASPKMAKFMVDSLAKKSYDASEVVFKGLTLGEIKSAMDADPNRPVPYGMARNVLNFLSTCEWKKSEPVKAPVDVKHGDVFKIGNAIVKVMIGKNAFKRQYTKTWDAESGEWVYTNTQYLSEVSEDTRISLADAVAWAGVTGRCVMCGRTLNKKISVEAGIGPVCIKRIGGHTY